MIHFLPMYCMVSRHDSVDSSVGEKVVSSDAMV